MSCSAVAGPPKKLPRQSVSVVLRSQRSLWQISLILLGAIGIACATQPLNPVHDEQPWLKSLIANIDQQPVWNQPATITRYTYKGSPVYYVAPHCCDIRSKLYDASGAVICEPDGGITGKGDGKCDDFIATRTDEHLVWRDPRAK